MTIRFAYLVKNAALISIGLVLAYTVHRWVLYPFVFQIDARQSLTVLCQEAAACRKIGAAKVFERETQRIERRAVITFTKGASATGRTRLQHEITKAIEESAQSAPWWKRKAVRGMLPVEVLYE